MPGLSHHFALNLLLKGRVLQDSSAGVEYTLYRIHKGKLQSRTPISPLQVYRDWNDCDMTVFGFLRETWFIYDQDRPDPPETTEGKPEGSMKAYCLKCYWKGFAYQIPDEWFKPKHKHWIKGDVLHLQCCPNCSPETQDNSKHGDNQVGEEAGAPKSLLERRIELLEKLQEAIKAEVQAANAAWPRLEKRVEELEKYAEYLRTNLPPGYRTDRDRIVRQTSDPSYLQPF